MVQGKLTRNKKAIRLIATILASVVVTFVYGVQVTALSVGMLSHNESDKEQFNSPVYGLVLEDIPILETEAVNTPILPAGEVIGVLPLARTLTPKEFLYKFGGVDARHLDRIIYCESQWKALAESETSTALGLAQFLYGTWVSTRKQMGIDSDPQLRANPYESIRTMLYLYQRQGDNPWLASQHCWESNGN